MTGGWPLAVQLAAEVLRRVGPIDHSALVDRLLAPDAVLFEYLAEEVLAGAAEGERELLSIAVRLPQVSPAVLGEIGRPDLVAHLAPLGDTGIFLDSDMSTPDRYRPSVLGGEFVRRVLPAPPEAVLRAAVAAFVRLGEIESALVLCAEVGDPELALEVVLGVERPDRLRTTEALAGALRLADAPASTRGSPSCRATSATCAASGTTPCARTSSPCGSATAARPAWRGSRA